MKACIVCETPAANMNSSLSSVLVLPRALVLRKKINIFRFVVDSVVFKTSFKVNTFKLLCIANGESLIGWNTERNDREGRNNRKIEGKSNFF